MIFGRIDKMWSGDTISLTKTEKNSKADKWKADWCSSLGKHHFVTLSIVIDDMRGYLTVVIPRDRKMKIPTEISKE